MKLSDLKWWHWTVATVVLAAAIRVATGGPLPFVGRIGGGAAPPPAPTAPTGRPAREPNLGPQMHDVVAAPGLRVELATPELDRLTIEATIADASESPAMVDATGALVREIAQALQKGVREDSSDITKVRILVATKGVDRTGKPVAHLSLYGLDYKAADLFAMKPTASPAQALGLAAAPVFNSAESHKAMRDWCAVQGNLNQALAFCAQVTAAKGV
jgi:hypothetical protein